MKILMLAHKVPHPLHDGYNLHNYHYTRQLGGRHEIHLLALGPNATGATGASGAEPGDLTERLDQFASIHVVAKRVPPRPSLRERLAGTLDPAGLHDFDPGVLAAIQEVLAAGDFDAVWVSGDKMLVYSMRLDLPVLGDVADDGARDAKSQWKRARGLRQWVRRGIDSIKMDRFQRAVIPHVSVCNMVSAGDRDSIIASVPGLEVVVINNGTDSEFFTVQGSGKLPCSLVFEGSMDFPPNADAAVYFCREILPLVVEREPATSLTLVGKNPLPEVRALAGECVEVTGTVDDVRPYLERAEVFVCPLISGSGIKNKVLQAWAMELPVVATPISTGGLKFEEGENLLLAEQPRAFADACLKLFSDPDLRRKLGQAGRATVLESSSWEAKGRAMESALQRVVDKGRV